jgi:hypothetical protein
MPSYGALVSNSDWLIQSAEELKRLKQERLDALARDGPLVMINDYSEYTIVLLRDGKERIHEFGENDIRVLRTKDESVRTNMNLDGPPDEDGVTHFVCVYASDWGQRSYGIQVTPEEAKQIKRGLDAINAELMAEYGDE